MDLVDVVRKRRMVRAYDRSRPVPREAITTLLDLAIRAPSAGFTQGWDFLVLTDDADLRRFWQVTTDPGDPDSWLDGMRTAPALVVCLSDPERYLDRYAEPDKGWTDRDPGRWPVPYWDVDTGMAALLMLLGAVDAGLGACFFGVPPERDAAVRAAFGIPDTFDPVGVVTIGHLADDAGAPGSPSTRRRLGLDEVVHRGHWDD